MRGSGPETTVGKVCIEMYLESSSLDDLSIAPEKQCVSSLFRFCKHDNCWVGNLITSFDENFENKKFSYINTNTIVLYYMAYTITQNGSSYSNEKALL